MSAIMSGQINRHWGFEYASGDEEGSVDVEHLRISAVHRPETFYSTLAEVPSQKPLSLADPLCSRC
jgi:hypothetical protein